MNIKIKPNNYQPKEPVLREGIVQDLVNMLLHGTDITWTGPFKDRYIHYEDNGRAWKTFHDQTGSSKKVVQFSRDEARKAVELLLKNGYYLKKVKIGSGIHISIQEWPGSTEYWTAIDELPKESWEE